MCNDTKTADRGFTLIELLVVIAIIGFLAAMVVISLSNRTGDASEKATKTNVSQMRTVAAVAVTSEGLSGPGICEHVYNNASVEKGGWEWNGANLCTTRTRLTGGNAFAGEAGEICCSASGTSWVIWSAFHDADGTGSTGTPDVYCADSTGFLGGIDVTATAAGLTDTSVEGGTGTLTKCRGPVPLLVPIP